MPISGNPLAVTTGGSGRVEQRAAVPVAVVSGQPPVAGRARRVVVVSSGPVEGGQPIPVADAGSAALYTDEPALPVYVVSGSLGGATAPSTLLPNQVSGLLAWYKADAITGLNDGDSVSTWNDSSGNANNLTRSSTTRPIYKTSIINSLPVVRFDGSTQYMDMATGLNPAAFHFFAVLIPSTSSTRTLMAGANNSMQYCLNAGKQRLVKTNAALIGAESTALTAIATVVSASYSSPNAAFFLNGAADGTASSAQTLSANMTFVGKQSLGEFFATDLAELIVYDNVLSTANRNGITAYLGAKYGITVT